MVIRMYQADEKRYEKMKYLRCGKSGIVLPRVSLGLWHNFGSVDPYENQQAILRAAFDHGITHYDVANNYGPIPGSAESNFGKMLATDFKVYRDEMIISTKAGYTMWDGPYGDWGSRKYLTASLDQSLQRMGLEYVDIFYHHRPDPNTPLYETMQTLTDIVRQGKALYVGISNYNVQETREAVEMLESMGTHCLIHQPRYSMKDRWVEDGLLDVLEDKGVGSICFSPLAQGLLTDRYKDGIPADSRASIGAFLTKDQITEETIAITSDLRVIAEGRGQTLAQMALSWVLRKDRVTSVVIGASRVSQLEDNIACINHLEFDEEELQAIEQIISRF